METEERRQPANPQIDANWCSKATFWWTNGILRLGYQRHLEAMDIYDVLPEDSSIKLSNGLGREWEKELYKWKTGGDPSLGTALFRCYGGHVIGMGIVFFLVEGLRIAQALFLGLIVTYFENDSSLSWQRAYVYAGCWSVCYILVLLLDNLAFHKSYYFGLKMRVACTSLIYRKLLRLSYQSLQDTSSSTIVSLLATDAHRFDQSCLGVNYTWIAPLESVAILLLLWIYLGLGATSLIGLVVLAILTPIQYLMGKFLSKLRSQLSQLTDRRVRVMSEILSGIRTIKINCWERAFTVLVSAIRKSEWTYIKVMSHIRGVNSAMYFISGKFLMFVTFVTYTLLGGQCTASTVFTVMALYEVLRSNVSLLLPWGIQHYIEAKSAIHRIQKYLLLEEKGCLDLQTHSLMAGANLTKRAPLPLNIVVEFEDFSAAWGKEKSFALENINLSIERGQYTVITGPGGSGKSSMLLAIAGELPRLGGFVRSRGKLGLVTQNPWLFPGTIRENILFGSDLERRRYNKVLYACGVLQDIELFENGDLSVVGDKDVPLTTGHKSRICLARAVYQSCDVYLIDDIFSHMEDASAVHIFTKCFCGIISTKAIVLVTQNFKFIKAADHMAVMVQGKIVHQGSYDDIERQGVDIEKLLLTYQYYQHLAYRQPPHPQGNEDGSDVVECDIYASQTSIVRQRSGLDSSYGSSESLDHILLEYDHGTSDTDVTDEDTELTPVGCGVYFQYLSLGGGLCGVIGFFFLCIITQTAYVMCDWWLYIWVTSQSEDAVNMTSSSERDHSSPAPIASIFPFTPHTVTPNIDFYVYLGIFLGFIMCGFATSSVFSMMTSHVARTLHHDVYIGVLRAPLAFVEKTTSGRILSRFSRDVGFVDDPLPATYFDCVQFLLLVLGASLLTIIANYWLLLVVIPVIILFIAARQYFISTAREVKRLELTAKTPIYQHISNTLEGMWTIRSFDVADRFLRTFDGYQDRHTAASYVYLAVQRWFALRLDILGVVFVALLAFVSVAVKDMINPGLMGMALAYAINVMGLFQYTMRQSAELEHQLSGLERLMSYSDLPSEGAVMGMTRPAPSWPQYGIVTFEGYTLIDDDGCKQLKSMWGCIRAEEKVGVLSRQEGSKKAIVSAILRLTKPHAGILRIDGMDTSELGLQDVRERMAHIDQDPVLFSGSLRRNLDPFTRYPDANLWKVLEEVSLKERVDILPGKLYADMAEFGNNLVQGDRQLLGLARALLNNSKIVIFEEASSVIDKHTEAIIRHTLSSKFPHKTVIVIAQRVHTAIDMDRVLILEEGKIKEFDPPHQLLQNKFSAFSHFVNAHPAHEVALLRTLAQDKDENRPYRPPPHSLGGEGEPYAGRALRHFLPSFQSTRLTGVLSHFAGNRFSTNRF